MKSKVAKILVLFFSLIICLSGFCCCGKDKFVTVKRVEWVMDGEKSTKSSYRQYCYSTTKLSEAEAKSRGIDSSMLTEHPTLSLTSDKMYKKHKQLNFLIFLEESERDTYYTGYWSYTVGRYTFFHIHTLYAIEYFFVQVLVVDDDTIRIKDYTGTTTYNVDSYRIYDF